MTSLTPEAVPTALRRFFPARNDDFPSDYGEELAEIRAFGITTEEQFDEMFHRRAKEVMEIDRSPMSEDDIRMHIGDSGKAYEEYADRRDGIVEPEGAGNSHRVGQ